MNKKKLHIYIKNLLFALIIIYFSQGSLYSQGSILSQTALATILLISSFYLLLTLRLKKKEAFYKIWTIFLLFNVFGFIFTTTINNSVSLGMLKAILMTFLLFYPFYFYSRFNLIAYKHLLIFFFILLPITILSFYFNQSNLLLNRLSGNDDVVNNITFTFARLIPFVFLFRKNKLLSSASLIVLIYFVILGSKRGTLIAAIVGVLIFAYYQLSMSGKKHKIRDYIIGIIFIGLIGYFFVDFYSSNEFLLRRMTDLYEGNSSGRDIIYTNLFNAWFDSDSFFRLILGFGFGSSQYMSGTGNTAHNDILEILSNFGLIGLILYIVLLYQVFNYITDKSNTKQNRFLMLASISIWILIGLTARSYYAMDGYLHSIIFAYLFGSKYIKSANFVNQ